MSLFNLKNCNFYIKKTWKMPRSPSSNKTFFNKSEKWSFPKIYSKMVDGWYVNIVCKGYKED